MRCPASIVALVPTAATRREVRFALRRLSDADLDLTVYRHEALALLDRAVGFDAWCWTLVDPDSDLPAHAVAENPAVACNPARFHQLMYRDHAALSRTATAAPGAAVSLLSQATGGDLRTSRPWREVLGPAGLGDVLDARLVSGCVDWSHLSLYRGADRGWFTEKDRAFIAELAPRLADKLRGAIRTAGASDAPDDFDEPGTPLARPAAPRAGDHSRGTKVANGHRSRAACCRRSSSRFGLRPGGASGIYGGGLLATGPGPGLQSLGSVAGTPGSAAVVDGLLGSRWLDRGDH